MGHLSISKWKSINCHFNRKINCLHISHIHYKNKIVESTLHDFIYTVITNCESLMESGYVNLSVLSVVTHNVHVAYKPSSMSTDKMYLRLLTRSYTIYALL